MKSSKLCFDVIKHFEGCKTIAYRDAVGIWSIGYGNTFMPNGASVKQGDVITKADAEAILPIIVEKFAISVYKALKVEVKQHEFDALVSLTYNIGIGNFERSTLLKFINKGYSKQSICSEFLVWNKANRKVLAGLTRRRQCEAHLYLTGDVQFNFI